MARTLSITLNDLEAAAEDAYDMFVASNTHPRPWGDLAEVTRERWRGIARGLLQHVVTVQR